VCRSWTDNSDEEGRCKNIVQILQSGHHETFAMLAILALVSYSQFPDIHWNCKGYTGTVAVVIEAGSRQGAYSIPL
jgi:hypothetical protein